MLRLFAAGVLSATGASAVPVATGAGAAAAAADAPLAPPPPPAVPCNPHASPPEVCPVSGVPCPPSGMCPAAAAGNASDPALVYTTAGPLRGIAGEKYRMWLGVPFAEPPLDELRWMPPRPKASWAPTTLEAFDKKNNCAQNSMFGGWETSSPDDPHGSVEDCLYMNVWAPPLPASPSTLYPVLFFIVGGDYDSDGSANGATDGRGIVEAADAVVIVANYRLGVLGFLGSDELRSLSPDNSTGNTGMQDQRLALQWIQDNAEAFHIDKTKVMIFGESSGAGCVSNHMV
jgi:para-nitrobenzyl esterase